MARRAEGWKLVLDRRTGIYYVRFTLPGTEGARRKISTGERDPRRAAVQAGRVYANEIQNAQGSRAPLAEQARASATSALSSVGLDEIAASWLADVEAELDVTTVGAYKLYVRTHWTPFFKTLDRINASSVNAYMRSRLRAVRRQTVLKELSALRRFLGWAQTEGYIQEVPEVRSPPRTTTGVDYLGGARKKIRVELTEDEARAVLDRLAERTKGGHPAKAFFTVMYETSLRRSTLFSLVAPGDYAPGRPTLRIRDEIDKARFGRELPISDRARAALDSVCPKSGRIFQEAEYRTALRTAALGAGLDPHRAKHLSYHDWRHASLTHLASATTDLAGLAYLAGHKDVSTTAKYVHANIKGAQRVLNARATQLADEQPARRGRKGRSGARRRRRKAKPKPA